MKRLKKFLLIAAVALAVVVAAGIWALDRWLQSPGTHARLQRGLSEAMHMPLKFTKLTLSAWGGLSAEGVSAAEGDGNFFEAASVSASHRFSSLVRGRIVLGEVRIVRPRIRMTESPDGRWHLPGQPPAVAKGQLPATAGTTRAKSKKRPDVLVEKITIADGSAELIDRQQAPVATLEGLHATFKDVSGQSAAGAFDISKLAIHGYATLENVKGNAEHSDGSFTVRNLLADVCGGRLGGEFTWTDGAPENTRFTLADVNVGLAGKDARARLRNGSGIVSGEGTLAGLGDLKTMTGQGTLTVKSGSCREIELIRQIGEVLQYAAIAGFEVREARTSFRIGGERVSLTPLDVSLHPLGMSVSGSIGFDGLLEMVGTLTAPADFVEKSGSVSGQFSPRDQNGRRSVQFDIKGTLDKPKQNLAERLTGTRDRKWQRIIAAESILSNLLGPKKPKPAAAAPEAPPQP